MADGAALSARRGLKRHCTVPSWSASAGRSARPRAHTLQATAQAGPAGLPHERPRDACLSLFDTPVPGTERLPLSVPTPSRHARPEAGRSDRRVRTGRSPSVPTRAVRRDHCGSYSVHCTDSVRVDAEGHRTASIASATHAASGLAAVRARIRPAATCSDTFAVWDPEATR